MERTIRLLLQPTSEQAAVLRQTLEQFTSCFNHVCKRGWQAQSKNGVDLHKQTYYFLRGQHPELPSNLLIQARVKATEAVASALVLKKKGRKTSRPRSQLCPARYNQRTYTLKWDQKTVSLASTEGRLTIPFQVPAYALKYAGYPTATADLILRKNRLWLHVVVDVPAPQIRPTDEVVGVDLGINRPAVTSNNRFLGERRWKELEARTFRLRRSLQAKGTRSARRHLRRLSGKQLRRRRDHDHVLSKRIVQTASEGETIVLENLTDIRKRVKRRRKGGHQRRLHSWSFDQLAGFVTYKAQEKGIRVVKVDPRKTSQTCTQCGHAHRSNRKSQSVFKCRQCGYELNADLLGARGVRLKYLAQVGKSDLSGPQSIGLSSQPLG